MTSKLKKAVLSRLGAPWKRAAAGNIIADVGKDIGAATFSSLASSRKLGITSTEDDFCNWEDDEQDGLKHGVEGFGYYMNGLRRDE